MGGLSSYSDVYKGFVLKCHVTLPAEECVEKLIWLSYGSTMVNTMTWGDLCLWLNAVTEKLKYDRRGGTHP